jgi:magnesium-transporting ATPase (P-type)
MKETYTSQDSGFTVSSASSSHEQQGLHRPPGPLDSPEDDDEPPIRPPDQNQKHHQDVHDAKRSCSPAAIDSPPPVDIDLVIEKRPFYRDPSELAEYLYTSLSLGLSSTEVQSRLKKYGKNILKGQERVTIWLVLWRQVSNAMTVILLGALAIAFATEDYAEGGVIAGIPPLPLMLITSHRRCKCRNRVLSGIPC